MNGASLTVDVSGIPRITGSQVITQGSTNQTSYTTMVSRSGSGWLQLSASQSNSNGGGVEIVIDGVTFGGDFYINVDIANGYTSPIFRYESSFDIRGKCTVNGLVRCSVVDWRDA